MPPWWDWELASNPHLLKRMSERGFSDTDLRRMLVEVLAIRPDIREGRWLVTCGPARRPWQVVLEPDYESQVLVVITAYCLDG